MMPAKRPKATSKPHHVDVLIVGAGISGVGAAYHLKTQLPGTTFLALEAKETYGGTWVTHRYPGIRSDSDMHTLGYRFKPWREAKAIADGPSILKYIQETAAEYDVDRHVRYQHLVTKAEWSSESATWTVEAKRKDTGETARFTCNVLLMCAGYYSYREGYTPEFAGVESFKGRDRKSVV